MIEILKAYLENSPNDLMNAATASLDSYEHSKNVRLNFFFHDEAIRHLARLTRVFVRYFFILECTAVLNRSSIEF